MVLALMGSPASASAGEAREIASTEVSVSPQSLVGQSLSGFDAGNLIDDTVFFSKDTMTADQIQGFLNGKVSACRSGYTCLRDFGMATSSRPADAMCRTPYTGRAWESAAQIIYNVAQACGINPQVLLVTLQKEQGLVTHTWPSDWRYTMAMGQGCPDTAACDARYNGFFNQVYGAAWQFKRYSNPPGTSNYFTWYAPGRTWNIQFHPNTGCGSSPVHVANQATANLYYYTPYQPNAAALRAGVGEGDSCSAYGNRNFYNYFTDWFGSTRAATITLAKSESSATVWIVSQDSRWALTDATEWNELNQVFGPTYSVAEAYLQARSDRGIGSNVVRDSATGAMAVIDDGKSWGLASCADVATWGGSCANPVNLTSSIYQRVPSGADVGPYLRTHGATTWGRVESGTIRVLYDATSAKRLNGGILPDAPRMSGRAYSALPRTATVFAPGELVYARVGGTVSMTDGWQRLIDLPSWNTVREMGLAPESARMVAETSLAPYASRGDLMSALIRCGDTTFFPASGTLHPLSNPVGTGLDVTSLDAATCATLRLSSSPLSAVLVKAPSDATVYHISAGSKRALTTWSDATALGGASPTILTVSQDWIASISSAAAPIPDGTLVKASGASVYLLSGQSLLGVPSFALTRELGFGASFRQVSDGELVSLGSVGPSIGLWVSCAGTTFFAANGVLHVVEASDPSFAVTALSDGACAKLNLSGFAVSRVFIQGSDSSVYVARNGAYSPISSWARLLQEAGGATPSILRVSDATLKTLPLGPVLP